MIDWTSSELKTSTYQTKWKTLPPTAVLIPVPVVETAESEPLKSCSFIRAMRILAKIVKAILFRTLGTPS